MDRPLAAKLSVPALPPHYLNRDRLFAELGTTQLTAVTGPAGSGKSLLVAGWVRAGLAPGPTAWLTLGTEDDVPVAFWAAVIAAFRPHLPGAALGPPPRRTGPRPVDRSVIDRLADALAARPGTTVLVLDRAESLRDRAIGADLDLLLRYAGAKLRLVMVGRRVRVPPTNQYRLTAEFTEVDGRMLALRPQETEQLLAGRDAAWTPEETAAVQVATEGWIAGVCLSTLARRPGARVPERSATGVALVDEYLHDEVLDPLAPLTRELLLRSSILTDVDVELANRLTGRFDAQGALEELVRENALVTYSGPASYRLHPLLRSRLQVELAGRHDADLVRRLHGRAARWYADQGRLDEALTHALATQDWAYATRLMVSQLGVVNGLVTQPGRASLALLAALPPEFPGLPAALLRATAALTRYEVDVARAELRRALSLTGEHPENQALAVQLSTAVLEVTLGRLAGATATVVIAVAEAEQLAKGLPLPPALADGGLRAFLLAQQGAAQLWAGERAAAGNALQLAVASAGPAGSYGAPDALGQLALLALVEGKLSQAARHARAAIEVAVAAGISAAGWHGTACTVLAGVALQRDDLAGVRENLTKAVAAAGARSDPLTAVSLALIRSSASLDRMDGRRAIAILQTVRTSLAGHPLPEGIAEWLDRATAGAYAVLGEDAVARATLAGISHDPGARLDLAQLELRQGNTATASRLAEAWIGGTTPGSAALRIRAALLRAELAIRDGAVNDAWWAVREALDLGRPEQIRRPFVAAREWMRPLLRSHPGLVADHQWLEPGTSPRDDTVRAAETGIPVERLTGRERDVLNRLAQALSTDDIATDLHLSVNTVKTHLKSIYRKLGTTDRSMTARRARELNLLGQTPEAG